MSNDYLQQGDYYASLYRLHQLTNRQLREEQLWTRRSPSLVSRMLKALGNRLQQPGHYPLRWRARLRLS